MTELDIYNEIREKIFLDGVLPVLEQAQIDIVSSKPIAKAHLLNELKDLTSDNGWCQYNDKFKLGQLDANNSNIIEGEWHKDNTTTTVQLLNNNSYQITTMKIGEGQNKFYHEQSTINRLSDKKKTYMNTYRIWWDCIEDRYQPIAQQYIGSTLENNSSEKNHDR